MSRRTPIKELIAEDAGTPSSPIRRSNRIAVRRSSAQDESQKLKPHDEDDRISISSTSSIGSKSGRKTRTSSKSPLPPHTEDGKVPARRTRKGSTSSLIEEELSMNRGGSPTPGRLTRRSLARSLSVSPVSELENRTRKTSTPQKSLSESATSKGGGTRKGRRLSTSEAPLESIKESPQKENINGNAIEDKDEKDLPIKKKKSALLQTIAENNETNKTENDSSGSVEEPPEKPEDESNKEKETPPSKPKRNSGSSTEEKELMVVLTSMDNNDEGTKNDLNSSQQQKPRPSLSLKPKRSLNVSTEDKELVVVLNNMDKHDNIQNISKDLNTSQSKENSLSKEVIVEDSLILQISGSEDEENHTEDVLDESTTDKNKFTETRKEELQPSDADIMECDEVIESGTKNVSEEVSQSPSNKKRSLIEKPEDKSNKEKETSPSKPKRNSGSLTEEKELTVVLTSMDISDSKSDLNSSQQQKPRPSLSLKPKRSLNVSTEDVVLNNMDKHDNSQNISKDLNTSQSKENSLSKEVIEEDSLILQISGSEDEENHTEDVLDESKTDKNKFTETRKEELQPSDADTMECNEIIESGTKNVSEEVSQSPSDKKSSLNETEIREKEVTIAVEIEDDGVIESDSKNTSVEVHEPMDVDEPVIENTSSSISNQKDTTVLDVSAKTNVEPTATLNTSGEHIDGVDSSSRKEKSMNESTSSNTSIVVTLNTSSKSNTQTIELDSIFITTSPNINAKSKTSCASPDQSNISPNKESSNVIVATNLTPVRRSPRLNVSPEKKANVLSSNSAAEDILKINTPPDSIKSEASSKDTDLDVSGTPSKENTSKSKNSNTTYTEAEHETGVNKDNKKEEDVDTSQNKADLRNDISFSSQPELNETLQKRITELTERMEVDVSSDESVSNFIEDAAEEGEEDTPSEGSNDIIDLGESVGSTASEIDSDESYELDSFIDDEEAELLSGEEYDLGQEKSKSKPKSSKSRSRIIPICDSTDEEEEETTEVVQELPKQNGIKNKTEEDSDVEKMSTQPYCGLTPPSIVSIRDSPSEEEKSFNNKDDEESVTSELINKEDNLKSLEEIQDRSSQPEAKALDNSLNNKSLRKINPIKVPSTQTPVQDSKCDTTPNNSILETSASRTDSKSRKRLSSLTIQETVSVKDISDGHISDRILKVVEVFCSTVTKSDTSASGNISLNVSLDYISTSPNKPNIHKEHKEVLSVEPLRRNLQTSFNDSQSDLEKTGSAKKRRKRSSVTTKSPVKTDDQPMFAEEKSMSKDPEKQSKVRKNKKSKKDKTVDASDSDMSPDLDKELDDKYVDVSEDNDNAIEYTKFVEQITMVKPKKRLSLEKPETSKKVTSSEPKEKRIKIQESSNETDWQIEYLPRKIKAALSKSSKIPTQKLKYNMPNKKPHLLPSLTNGNESWERGKIKTKVKPTASLKTNECSDFNVEVFHIKDFKNRTLYDSKRVKRIDTKELLKKKQKKIR